MSRIPDEFVPLHIHYRRDRAIRRAGAMAELLYLRALAHSRAADSDGRIEDYDLDIIGQGIDNPEQAAERLVAESLWVVDGDGWVIRSWEKWNPGTASDAASGSYGNHVRWHEKRGEVSPECPHCPSDPDSSPRIAPDSPPISDGIAPDIAPDSPGISRGESPESQNRREEKREDKKRGAKRRTRIPDTFAPSDSNIAYAAEHHLDLDHEVEQFRNHHGAKGTLMVDWQRALRTWLGNAATNFGRGRPVTQLRNNPYLDRAQTAYDRGIPEAWV